MSVRVRFAPSPTGYLHVGSARTALFNWLYARHHGGTFILRIEDTDAQRSTGEAVDIILDSLRWLGLDWDEGPEIEGAHAPYFQSQRGDIYRKYAEQLLAARRAYRCYCTSEELDERRKAALARGEAPKYDRKCLGLIAAEHEKMAAEGRTCVIRFKSTDEGKTTVHDAVLGPVEFENKVLDDFVMIKSDGMPAYNFAVVVDDASMEITHVIRGADHLSNTPKQIQVYEALGLSAPTFAHIPLILAPDRSKLSKRHGTVAVTEYREIGYMPEAMVNYLSLLGWGYDASQQLFTLSELVEKFSLERVSKNAAIFDMKKFEWMNGVYLRDASPERFWELAETFLRRAGLLPDRPSSEYRDRMMRALLLVQSRVKSLAEVPEWVEYFFQDEVKLDEKAAAKHLFQESVPKLFAMLLEGFLKVDVWEEQAIGAVFEQVRDRLDMKLGDVIQPVRVAITGKTVSPGMYEVLALLGKAATCHRLKERAERVKEHLNRI